MLDALIERLARFAEPNRVIVVSIVLKTNGPGRVIDMFGAEMREFAAPLFSPAVS